MPGSKRTVMTGEQMRDAVARGEDRSDWERVRRNLAQDPQALEDNRQIGEGMNPAHIIYQVLTDPDWGYGAAPSDIIDEPSFLKAAQTLHAEGFGQCGDGIATTNHVKELALDFKCGEGTASPGRVKIGAPEGRARQYKGSQKNARQGETRG